jgi:carboxyl-terminal processing protease
VQRQYILSDGSALLLTVARYYTPSGRLIQRPYEDRDEYLEHWRTEDVEEAEGEGEAVPAPPDTAGRPVFYTLNEKRPVYGGGGIAPDIRIADTFQLNEVQSKLEQSRLFFEVGNEFAARNLDRHTTDVEDFLDTFQVPDTAIAEFRRRALATDVVKLTADEVDAETEYIAVALKREIAGNLWGSEARYRVVLNEDPVLAEATTHFPEATTMARLYQEAMENQR